MELQVTARHFDLTPELKVYAESTVFPLKKYFDRIIDSHLVLDIQKRRMIAELTVDVFGQKLIAHSITDDLYVSIDGVVDKMQRQLKRYSARFNEHRGLTDEEKINLAAKITSDMENEIQDTI